MSRIRRMAMTVASVVICAVATSAVPPVHAAASVDPTQHLCQPWVWGWWQPQNGDWTSTTGTFEHMKAGIRCQGVQPALDVRVSVGGSQGVWLVPLADRSCANCTATGRMVLPNQHGTFPPGTYCVCADFYMTFSVPGEAALEASEMAVGNNGCGDDEIIDAYRFHCGIGILLVVSKPY